MVAHDLHPDYLSTRLRARARGRRAGRGPAPPRAPRGLPRRARRARAGGRRDLRRQRATGPTAPSGAARSWSATWPASSAPGCCSRSACRAATRPSREPWRMACAWLAAALEQRAPPDPGDARAERSTPRDWEAVCALVASGLNSPLTTSAGRLFDAVAALCGVRRPGQPRGSGGDRARGAARDDERGAYPMALIDPGPERAVDHRPARDDPGAAATTSTRASTPRSPRRASTKRSPAATARPAPRGRAPRPRSSSWSSPAACFRTGCCSSARASCCAPSGLRGADPRARCRPTTAGSPTDRSRSRRRGKRRAMSFEFLFEPLEDLDAWLTGLFDGRAAAASRSGSPSSLGLRHASDPDHLVAVTSLVAADDGDPQGAVRLGAWWGLGHAAILLGVGLPLIAFKSELPGLARGRRREGGRGRDRPARRPGDAGSGCAATTGSARTDTAELRRRRRSPPPPAPRDADDHDPRPRAHPAPGVRRSASCTGSPAPARSSWC